MKEHAIPAILFSALLALTPAAWAQAPCSIQTVTGTYAFQVDGTSAVGSIFESQLGPTYELHGGSVVLVGQATIAPDGRMTGTYWGVWAAFPIPPTALAGHMTVNADCTGEFTDDATGVSDTMVVLANGSKIQSMGWNGSGTSVSTFYRIVRADDPAPRCGPQTVRGTYTDLCRGFALDESGDVATTTVMMVWTASDGTFTGTYRQKTFGLPESTLLESDVAGTYTVDGDCTVETTFSLEAMPGLTVKGRGVIFEQGKRALGVPLGIYSGDTMIAPIGPLICEPTARPGR